MNLGDGLWTHPEADGAGPDYPAWRLKLIEPLMPEVVDKTCLDIGCSSGFFSLKLKELGARYVLGVDHGEQTRAMEQARFAAGCVGLSVDFRPMSVYDVKTLGQQFDLVLFMGVFYHLRHPLLALESIREICRGTLLIQTITTPHESGSYEICPAPQSVDSGLRADELNEPNFPLLRFVEGGLDGDSSCWFVPNINAVLGLLRSSGFKPDRMIRPSPHEVIIRASVV